MRSKKTRMGALISIVGLLALGLSVAVALEDDPARPEGSNAVPAHADAVDQSAFGRLEQLRRAHEDPVALARAVRAEGLDLRELRLAPADTPDGEVLVADMNAYLQPGSRLRQVAVSGGHRVFAAPSKRSGWRCATATTLSDTTGGIGFGCDTVNAFANGGAFFAAGDPDGSASGVVFVAPGYKEASVDGVPAPIDNGVIAFEGLRGSAEVVATGPGLPDLRTVIALGG